MVVVVFTDERTQSIELIEDWRTWTNLLCASAMFERIRPIKNRKSIAIDKKFCKYNNQLTRPHGRTRTYLSFWSIVTLVSLIAEIMFDFTGRVSCLDHWRCCRSEFPIFFFRSASFALPFNLKQAISYKKQLNRKRHGMIGKLPVCTVQ